MTREDFQSRLVESVFPPPPEGEEAGHFEEPAPDPSIADKAGFKSPPEIAYRLPGLNDREHSAADPAGDLTPFAPR